MYLPFSTFGLGADQRARSCFANRPLVDGSMMHERIAVIGLGYVGLPVAVGIARAHGARDRLRHRPRRVSRNCAAGIDATGEVGPTSWPAVDLRFTADPADLAGCNFFIVTVPTPIDADRQPDLGAAAQRLRHVGAALAPGDIVVFESTVYPGVTEEVCGPCWPRPRACARAIDFTLGYSPERINPGDREHRLETIIKVVAGEDAATLERVAAVYGSVVTAGIHRAPSIRGRRSRQGHREHPARPQHRADERARADLRPAGHRHRATCWRRPAPSGTSCRSRRAWSAATASASIPTTSPPRPSSSATIPR